jgi:hypothetical protein
MKNEQCHHCKGYRVLNDANGNLTQDAEKTYTWDVANRLVGISVKNPQPATVADTITMTYDGKDRRVGII